MCRGMHPFRLRSCLRLKQIEIEWRGSAFSAAHSRFPQDSVHSPRVSSSLRLRYFEVGWNGMIPCVAQDLCPYSLPASALCVAKSWTAAIQGRPA